MRDDDDEAPGEGTARPVGRPAGGADRSRSGAAHTVGSADGGEDAEDRPERSDRPGRSETPIERSDRNWDELMQELRVTQTGIQILTAFLLTLPFQPRFTELSGFQQGMYLVLVALAVTTTALLVAPVSLHRRLFQRRRKPQLVQTANTLAKMGLLTFALVITGTAAFVFEMVLGPPATWIAAGATAVLLAVVWLALPWRIDRGPRPTGHQ